MSATVDLVITSASALRDTGWGGAQDPYVKVVYGANIERTPVAKNSGVNPEWGHACCMRLDRGETMEFEILNKNKMGRDSVIGSTSLEADRIEQLLDMGPQALNLPVSFQSGGKEKVVRRKGAVQVQIDVVSSDAMARGGSVGGALAYDGNPPAITEPFGASMRVGGMAVSFATQGSYAGAPPGMGSAMGGSMHGGGYAGMSNGPMMGGMGGMGSMQGGGMAPMMMNGSMQGGGMPGMMSNGMMSNGMPSMMSHAGSMAGGMGGMAGSMMGGSMMGTM